MSEHLLVVEGLRAGYGPAPVLHGVDLHVGAAEIVVVLGVTDGAGPGLDAAAEGDEEMDGEGPGGEVDEGSC